MVAALDVSHDAWRLAIGAIGGGLTLLRRERHGRDAERVLADARRALDDARRDLGPRLRAVGVALPGTISAGRLLQASHLGWQDLDIAAALRLDAGLPVLVGNDATLGGVAEARRGGGRGAALALHLTVEVGIGGALLDHGRPIGGSTGTGGEFGHLPFGDPARPCPCGGSWLLGPGIRRPHPDRRLGTQVVPCRRPPLRHRRRAPACRRRRSDRTRVWSTRWPPASAAVPPGW